MPIQSPILTLPLRDCTGANLVALGAEGYRLLTVADGMAVFVTEVRLESRPASPATEQPKEAQHEPGTPASP